jgi:HAE1 family hydrophobic/amphiphilic exporter-1
MVLKALPDNPRSVETYRTFFEDEVRQDLERVKGVAELMVYGGTEREMQVMIDPSRLAAHGLTINDLRRVLEAENVNISAGNLDVGRRAYRIRTVGNFSSPDDIEQVVIQSTGQNRIRVGDVARVSFGYAKRTVSIQHNGDAGIVCGIKAEPGANVLDVTNDTEAVVNALNDGILKENGLFFEWSSDQRPYINGAIDLVKQNIIIGGVLAVCVLLVFLQSVSSTVIVAVAIPISVVGTFIFMNLFGRNLNVVSLAGISFAVGMLVDNAIVVLENIDRHRSMGKSPYKAAYEGTREVWGGGTCIHADHGGGVSARGLHRTGSRPAFQGHRHRRHLRHHSVTVCFHICHPHAGKPLFFLCPQKRPQKRHSSRQCRRQRFFRCHDGHCALGPA